MSHDKALYKSTDTLQFVCWPWMSALMHWSLVIRVGLVAGDIHSANVLVYVVYFITTSQISKKSQPPSMKLMMMMMMMSGFVERVINSPQTRCRSAKQAFKCRANVRGDRVAVRRAAGKLFQMTGPATAKLLIPSVVVVLGTDSIPVRADRRCMAEIAIQSSAMYVFISHKKIVNRVELTHLRILRLFCRCSVLRLRRSCLCSLFAARLKIFSNDLLPSLNSTDTVSHHYLYYYYYYYLRQGRSQEFLSIL